MPTSNDLPPLNGLRAFAAAGRHLTFRAAADELGVTQGAVAQQVRGLEDHLNLRLFLREPRGLAFTEEGRTYHIAISRAFDQMADATDALRTAPSHVTISVTPTFASKWLIPRLSDFTEAHPGIDLRITATERVASFHADGIDLDRRYIEVQPVVRDLRSADVNNDVAQLLLLEVAVPEKVQIFRGAVEQLAREP